MFAKPVASGMVLTALIVIGGGALLQSEPDSEARTAVVTAEPERTATAPNRVVDSAGFPVVSGEDAEAEEEAGPIVTVNGRPLNGAPASQAAEPAPPAVAETPAPAENRVGDTPEVALVVPRPIPRPEGLSVPAAPQPNYETIATTQYGEVVPPSGVTMITPETGEFMSRIEREALANGTYIAPNDPRREGLVAVVGPNGEPIWIYEDQMRPNTATGSGVPFAPAPVQSNPYGFVYDEYGW